MWVLTQWNDAVNLEGCHKLEIQAQPIVDSSGEHTEYILMARWVVQYGFESWPLAWLSKGFHAEELRRELIFRQHAKQFALTDLRELLARLEQKTDKK